MVPERAPGDRRRQVEQAQRLIVRERDPTSGVQGEHALADAVQHRVALLEEPGDLARAEAEGLTIDAPGKDQRSADPESQRKEHRQAHRRERLRELLGELGIEEADRHDPDHVAAAGDRHFGAK